MDGKLVIGTEIDTSGVEDGLEELYKLIDNSDVGKNKATTVIGENAEKEAKKVKAAYEDVFEETENMVESSGINLLNEQIALVTDKLEGLRMEYTQLKNDEPYDYQQRDLLEYAQKISTTEKQLERLKQQADELNNRGFNNVKKSIDDVGKGLTKTVNSVKKWVLGIFGVYSAYGAIRNAMNVISSNDAQLKADIDYMKNVLAYTLEPVVRAIVNLAKQLLNYVAYIAKIFGVHIFENASNNLKKANKQAKALSKTLAGFDEMNILGGNTGSSGASASFDLAMPSEPPEWMNRLPGIIGGIAAALSALKLSDLLANLELIPEKLSAIKAIGIGVAIMGIIWLIQDLIKFLNDPTFDNFIATLKDISIAIIGIGIAVSSLPTIIAGVIVGIVYLFLKNYDTIMRKLGEFDKFMVWLWDKIGELFGPLGQAIFAPFMMAVVNIESIFKDLLTSLKRIVDGIVKMFKGDFTGGMKDVFGGLVGIIKTPLNAIIDNINRVIRGINSISFDLPDIFGGGHVGFNIRTIPRLAKGGIINMPGRGVPIAAGGERGAEGVIPLTDSQQMALLGEAIGKYITVNANIVNTMNGRVISRELQKVQNDSDFAYNR